MHEDGRSRTASPPAPPVVRQLEIRWQGQILEHLTVASTGRRYRRLSHKLTSGHRLRAQPSADNGWRVSLDGVSHHIEVGAPQQRFPCGLSVRLLEVQRSAPPRRFSSLDLGWVHALMLAAAVQIGGVSALMLSPEPSSDPGAGYRIEHLRRILRAPAGAAPTKGPGAVVRIGRQAEEAERPLAIPPARGVARPRREPKPIDTQRSLIEAIGSLEAVVQRGTPLGAELRQTIGDLARSTADAPTQGAGLGGLLRPREIVDRGAGSGIIGIGSDRIRRHTRRKKLFDDEKKIKLRPKVSRAFKTKMGPDGTGEDARDGWDLDPIVRDQLAKAVRRRQSSVRYCYVTWALQSDPTRTGRVVLELTLRPDGYVEDPSVTHDDPALGLVAECVERMAGDWYLGHGLVEENKRLAFPFILQPRVQTINAEPHTIEAIRPRHP